MVKINKLKKLGLALAVAAVAITPFFFQKESEAATTQFYDYSAVPESFSSDWARANLYYTSNTSVTVMQVGRSNSGDPGTGNMAYETLYHVAPNNTLVILIQNSSAKDSSGNPADVIMKVDIVRESENWSTSVTRDLYLYRRKYICGASEKNPSSSYCQGSFGEGTTELGVGDPIMFGIETRFDTADVTIQYIKKGTFNSGTMSGTPAGLTKMSYLVYDFDVPAAGRAVQYTDPNSTIMNDGNEAIFVPTYEPSTTKYYYNKNDQSGNPTMYTKDRGIGVSALSAGYSQGFNGIYYGSSVYGMVESMSSSQYKFSYTGTEAGVYFFFSSPIPNETPDPVKKIESGSSLVDSNRVTTNTTFNYVITQQTSENTETGHDSLTYASLYSNFPNIYSDRNYAAFEISDTLNGNLTPPAASSVKVYKGSTDVTSNFTVSVSGQKVTVAAKSDYATSTAFYATTFKVVFPVTTKGSVDTKTINNTASRSYRHANESTVNHTRNSNTVTTTIYHKLTVKHIDYQTNTNLADPTTTTHDHGYTYSTSALTNSQLPANEYYRVYSTPTNASGTLNQDTAVTYYYIRTRKLTVKHIDVQTSEEIVDASTTTHDYGYEYKANPLADDEFPEGRTYRLVAHPFNEEGTLNKDTTVIFYYLRCYKLTVKHIDDQTEEDLVDPVSSKHDNGYVYTTNALTPEQLPADEDYHLVATPDNANGTLTQDTTVTYRYIRHYKLTVKHIDLDTDEEIIDPVTTEHNRGYEYDTDPLAEDEFPDGTSFILVEEKLPENAEGTLMADTTVTYYYTRKFKLTVKYLEKGTDKELDETITSWHDRDYEYTTERSENVPSEYLLVEVPANAEGILNQDTVVIYYYNIPPIPVPVTLDNSAMPLFVVFGGLISGGAAIFFFLSKRR